MPRIVRVSESYSVLDKRRLALLKRMSRTGPFIMATATYLKVRCGNPNCQCSNDKKKRHEKLHLSWTDRDGNGTCYVPVALRQEVLEWIKNYWTMKDYMTQMTLLSRRMILMYAKTRGRFQKLKKKAKPPQRT